MLCDDSTTAETCDCLVDEVNPDDAQGYDDVQKRATESGGHKMEYLDMNWENG